METKNEIVSRLKEMKARLDALSYSDKKFIEKTQMRVLRRPFIRTTCGECYKEAVIEIYIYLQKNNLMEKTNYALHADVVLQPIESTDVYTNANLTDEKAEELLRLKPSRIKYFTHYPEDWEKRIGSTEEPKELSEPEKELITLLAEKLKAGATKAALKEEYKEYEIDGKKVTVRALDAYINKAKDAE
jgi:hypothetical protein